MFYMIHIFSPWNGRRKYKFPINRRNFNPAVLASNRQQILFTWCVRLGIDTNWILAFHALTFRPTLLRYWLLICLPSCYQYEWNRLRICSIIHDFKMKLHMTNINVFILEGKLILRSMHLLILEIELQLYNFTEKFDCIKGWHENIFIARYEKIIAKCKIQMC